MSVYHIQGVGRIVADQAFVEEHFPDAWELVPESQEPADPQPQRRLITRLAFRNRFTLSEKSALELAALDNPQADMSVRSQAASLRAYMKDVDSATFIDLDRADTRAGVQMLEAGGLIAPGRAVEILDAPVQPEEAPQ